MSFLNSIKNNELTLDIFNHKCSDLKNHGKNSQSFAKDILLLEKTFNLDIVLIFASPSQLELEMKKTFNERDGLTDSIDSCLRNKKKQIPIQKKVK